MRALPENRLDPRVKNVWRLSDAIWLSLFFLGALVTFRLCALIPDPGAAELFDLLSMVTIILWVLFLIIWVVVLPPIRYARWRYELTDEYLDIARGIIWRKRFIVPFIRVQNTDTRQGPILRMFGLASVTVSTAAGEHEIPGLSVEVSEQLRDKAAELARIAKEDV